jgi:hypothetical protein
MRVDQTPLKHKIAVRGTKDIPRYILGSLVLGFLVLFLGSGILYPESDETMKRTSPCSLFGALVIYKRPPRLKKNPEAVSNHQKLSITHCLAVFYTTTGVFCVTRISSRTRDWPGCVATAKYNFICVSNEKREKRMRDAGCCAWRYPAAEHPHAGACLQLQSPF